MYTSAKPIFSTLKWGWSVCVGEGGGDEVVGKIHNVFVMMMTTEIIEHTHKTENI